MEMELSALRGKGLWLSDLPGFPIGLGCDSAGKDAEDPGRVAQRGLTRGWSGRESSRVMGKAGGAGGGPALNSRMACCVTDRGHRCVYTDTHFAHPRRTCWGEPMFKKK